MKAILILAAAAVPALAQTAVRTSVAHSQPTCMQDGTCPTLSGTISRQLGMPAPVVRTAAVGGPYEPALTRAAMPAPTVGAYPPCRPGPGDDRCIQLYERGRAR